MTNSNETKTVVKSEALFLTVGKYIIFFQWIEGVVDQCLLLLWGHENWAETQKRLAGMRNQEKVDALLREFQTNPANLRGQKRPNYPHRFQKLVERLHEERRERNSLLHSQYIFDFLEIGQPILRSDRRKKNGSVTFQRQGLSSEQQEAMLNRVAHLAMDMNLAHVQLVHDFGAVEVSKIGA